MLNMKIKKTVSGIISEKAKDHGLLWIIAIISLIAAIWSSIPALYCIDWVAVEEDTAKGINAIVQGLSFSYFAAWIFYMLSDVVPSAQKRLDSIKKLGTYYTAIDEALMTIEGAAFMKKGGAPKDYTSNDLSNNVIETIGTPLAPDSSWGFDINVPISSKLSLAFTLVNDSQIKNISSITEDAISNTNQLLPHEVKQLLAIQSSKFISYFKNKQSILVIVNNREEINNVFDDFINLRKEVAKLKILYSE